MRTGLFAAVTAYTVALGMMGLVFVSSPPPRLLEGMADFQQGRALYQWGFVGASMLAPSFVAMLLLLTAVSGVPTSSTRRTIATVLLGAYVAAASFAYTSQYTFFPELVDRDPAGAAIWYFHDDESIPYAVDLVGYTILGLALDRCIHAVRGRSGCARSGPQPVERGVDGADRRVRDRRGSTASSESQPRRSSRCDGLGDEHQSFLTTGPRRRPWSVDRRAARQQGSDTTPAR